jgi:hypothetical protein
MDFIVHNIWYILGIVAIVLVGGGWMILATSLGHRIRDWMSPASDKFMPSKVFCEDKQIRDRRLKIGRYVISDVKKHRSFYLVHDLLLTSPGGRGKFLALTERNAFPIDFHNRIKEDEKAKYPSARRVFIDTTADIRSESSKEATSNFMAMSLSIMGLCGAIVVVVMGIIVFVANRGTPIE